VNRWLGIVIASAVLAFAAAPALALDGELDASFDGDSGTGNGIVTTAPGGGSFDSAEAVALQDDGRIVVAGHSRAGVGNSDFALARYNPNGTLDGGFGDGGVVTTPIGPGNNFAFGVAVQADGKIVAAGEADMGATSSDFAVARYEPDGDLDPSFDGDSGTGNGIVTTPVAPGSSDDGGFTEVVIDPADGDILVGGFADMGPTGQDFALVRHNASDGTLDDGFDGDGIVTTDFAGTSTDIASALALQADGKILAGGGSRVSDEDFAVARYNPDGSLDDDSDDSGFDGDGRQTTPISSAPERIDGLALHADGRIVGVGLAGPSQGAFGLVRYRPDGTLDPSFDGDAGNGNGVVTTSIGPDQDDADAVVIQPNQRIVVGGTSDVDPTGSAQRDVALARYNPADGTRDAGFAGDGTVITQIDPGGTDRAHALALQADGKILAVGEAGSGGGDFALVRYARDTTAPDTSIVAGPAAGATIADSTPSFGFSATEAGSTFECRLGGAFGPCSGPGATHTPARLADGRHSFQVRATDPAGNTDPTPATRAFTVDTTGDSGADTDPPETAITKAPKRKTKKRKAKLEFSSDEAGSTFECALDRKPFAACTSPFKKKVKRKKHSFRVRATDAAGNVDPTPAHHKWKVKRR
jgi:uncharacterized delta-60 repeat protein